MKLHFSLLSNGKTYGIELKERNYPKFEGKYNAYISVYGQLSGEYIGCFEEPLKMDITEDESINLLNEAEKFILNNRYRPVWIW